MMVGNYMAIDPVSSKAPFTDLPQRAVQTVSALYEAGVLQGKTKTLFGSNDTIKRGEAAIILSGLLPYYKSVKKG